jgi:hypothetical protein
MTHERGARLRQIGPIGLRPALRKYVISKYCTNHSSEGARKNRKNSWQETSCTIIRHVWKEYSHFFINTLMHLKIKTINYKIRLEALGRMSVIIFGSYLIENISSLQTQVG